jgi:hypothetical protein
MSCLIAGLLPVDRDTREELGRKVPACHTEQHIIVVVLTDHAAQVVAVEWMNVSAVDTLMLVDGNDVVQVRPRC